MKGDDPDRTWIMPKNTVAVLTAVLLLALTGCAGAVDNASSEPGAASQPAESPTAAPATAEPADPTATDADEWFLTHGFITTIDLPDADKLAAGYYACEQVGAGNLDVVAIDGVDADTNSAIVASATVILCPELADTYAAHRQN